MTVKHSYKEIERQRRENDILAAAEQLLIPGDYTKLNMDELANVVGISKPTLYQHFKSKEDLVVRVLLRNFNRCDEFLSRPLDEPAIDRLFELLRRFLAFQVSGSLAANLRADIRPEIIMSALHNFPGFEDGKRRFFQQINALVDTAKSQGSIDPDIPTPIVTHMIAALSQSLSRSSIQAELANDPAQMEAAVNSVLRVFLHGVAPLTIPLTAPPAPLPG